MANNHAIRLLGAVLLAGLAVSALCAQEASNPANGGSQDAVSTAATPPPATPSEGPPKAPKVTCAGDQLTISANNSTLGSVLAAVHACIGVQIDIPEGAGTGRTFEELGPGPERQVLETLLSGTDFDYVIGASDSDPGKVETVLLMERKAIAATNTAPDRPLTAGRRTWIEALRNARRAGTLPEDNSQPADESAESTASDEPAATPEPAENLNAVPASTPASAPASDTPPPAAEAPPAQPVIPDGTAFTPTGSPAPELSPSIGPVTDTGKSTDQRIAEMQQMFAQRRQINQNTNNTQPQQ